MKYCNKIDDLVSDMMVDGIIYDENDPIFELKVPSMVFFTIYEEQIKIKGKIPNPDILSIISIPTMMGLVKVIRKKDDTDWTRYLLWKNCNFEVICTTGEVEDE